MNEEKRYWFPAKLYGWGWGFPLRWQGWVVMLGYVALLGVGTAALSPREHLVAYLAYVAVLSVAFILIARMKGEPPRWRWGGDDGPAQHPRRPA
jgi:hypothetical protein